MQTVPTSASGDSFHEEVGIWGNPMMGWGSIEQTLHLQKPFSPILGIYMAEPSLVTPNPSIELASFAKCGAKRVFECFR